MYLLDVGAALCLARAMLTKLELLPAKPQARPYWVRTHAIISIGDVTTHIDPRRGSDYATTNTPTHWFCPVAPFSSQQHAGYQERWIRGLTISTNSPSVLAKVQTIAGLGSGNTSQIWSYCWKSERSPPTAPPPLRRSGSS
jgi:hypothetical protein